MTGKVRRILPLLAVLAIAAVIVIEIATAGGNGDAGKPAPALPTAVLQPPRETLASLRGKPALVNFWASWCEPCKKEAPELARLDRSLHGSASMVGIDYTDRADAARSFIRRYGWSFPVLSDPDGVYGARYGFSGLPTTVVLDSKGRIVETLRGPQTAEDLRQALRSAGWIR
jgi:cytochrome c biogenesis protein CcmG/thiol:disulfide interchange protein DsbE